MAEGYITTEQTDIEHEAHLQQHIHLQIRGTYCPLYQVAFIYAAHTAETFDSTELLGIDSHGGFTIDTINIKNHY